MQRDSRGELPTPFVLGEFVIRPDLNRIQQGGTSTQVEPKVMQVLVCLSRHPGQVVSRDALMDDVWGDVIVSDETLTVAVSELRRILCDDSRFPRFIETIRKSGYRLICPITAAKGREPEVVPSRPRLFAGRSRVVVPVVVVCLGLALAASAFYRRLVVAPVPAAYCASPVAVLPGVEREPAVSWDGTRVAFVWSGVRQENDDVYIMQRGADTPLRLTSDPRSDRCPSWSPDGTTIAFARSAPDGGILLVSSLGGSERRILATEGVVFGLDWSPDGRRIVYSLADSAGAMARLLTIDLTSLKAQALSDPAMDFTCDSAPRWSADGRWVAFVRSQHPAYEQDIFVMPAAGGEARRLTSGYRTIQGLDWEASSEAIVFGAAPSSAYRLWRVSLDGGAPEWIPAVSASALWPAVSRDADVLVYLEASTDFDVRRADIDSGGELRISVEPVFNSSRRDNRPVWSPDGTLLACLSDRTGSRQIWVCDAAGRDLRQVTRMDGLFTHGLCWSPDSRQIAFSALEGGKAAAYCVRLGEQMARRIRPSEQHQVVHGWSPDGDWIYYDTDPGGRWQIWRMKPDGDIAQAVSGDGCTMVGLLPASKRLVYMKTDLTGVFTMNQDGGISSLFIPDQAIVPWLDWVPTETGAYFLGRGPAGNVLGRYDASDGSHDTVGTIAARFVSSLALSPDGRSFLLVCSDRFETDLMWVQGYRGSAGR